MYIVYTNVSNNTPYYTHVNSYMVWRVHPLSEEFTFKSLGFIYDTNHNQSQSI